MLREGGAGDLCSPFWVGSVLPVQGQVFVWACLFRDVFDFTYIVLCVAVCRCGVCAFFLIEMCGGKLKCGVRVCGHWTDLRMPIRGAN